PAARKPAPLHLPGAGTVRLPESPVGAPKNPIRVVRPVHDAREAVRRPAEPLDAVAAEAARDPPLAAVRRGEQDPEPGRPAVALPAGRVPALADGREPAGPVREALRGPVGALRLRDAHLRPGPPAVLGPPHA